MNHRVVITGIGAYTPLGNSFQQVQSELYAGNSGLTAHTLGISAGQVTYDIDAKFDRFDIQITDRIARAAYLAYVDAKEDSKTNVDGVYFGTGAGGAGEISKSHDSLYKSGRVRPTSLVTSMLNGAANFIAAKDQITGPVFTYSAACSSSSVALGEAYRAIAHGDVTTMAAGGGEFCLTPLVIAQWKAMQALSDCCKPFSESRNGIALGEGAVIYILENRDSAIARGAHIYAEIVGYGNSCGAETMTKPNEAGQIAAIKSAIKNIDPHAVTYINAHGTGTPAGDLVELSSIHQVFGERTQEIPVSSTKVLHGHLLGNSGAMELLACLAVLDTDSVIPNWQLADPDPAISEHIWLPTSTVAKKQQVCLNNSFAFGGTNIVMAFQKVDT